jgi:hypothetical protein
VVFTYKGTGDASHHWFDTKPEADAFASDFRKGVYSLEDGTITSIKIVPPGKSGEGTKAVAGTKVGAPDKGLTSSTSQMKDDWRANVYNPPANLPKQPDFSSRSPLGAPAARVDGSPTTRAEGAKAAPISGKSWLAEKKQALEGEIGAMKAKGLLGTLKEEAIYRRESLKMLADQAERIDRAHGQAKEAEEFINKAIEWIGGEFQMPPHPAVEGAKAAVIRGVEEQEKNRKTTGDPGLDALLQQVHQSLKDLMKSPKSRMEDTAKERAKEFMDPK